MHNKKIVDDLPLYKLLKKKVFNFEEGVYVLEMWNVIVKDKSLIEISLRQESSAIKIVLTYDLQKLLNTPWNYSVVSWFSLISRKKYSTLNKYLTKFSKEHKAYLI